MFTAISQFKFGSAAYQSKLHLERRVRLFLADWQGSSWDTADVPASRLPPGHGRVLCILLKGNMRWSGPEWALALTGGEDMVLVTEEDLDGAKGKRINTFSTESAHFQKIELRVDRDDLGPNANLHRPYKMNDAVLNSASALMRFDARDVDGAIESVSTLLVALAEIGILRSGLEQSLNRAEPERLCRIWHAIAPYWENFDANPSLQDVADAAGISLRQAARDCDEFQQVFHLPVDKFRIAFLTFRVRFAIFLLNTRNANLAEVAERAGYGSTQAMTHAFRALGIRTPGELATRARLRFERTQAQASAV